MSQLHPSILGNQETARDRRSFFALLPLSKSERHRGRTVTPNVNGQRARTTPGQSISARLHRVPPSASLSQGPPMPRPAGDGRVDMGGLNFSA